MRSIIGFFVVGLTLAASIHAQSFSFPAFPAPQPQVSLVGNAVLNANTLRLTANSSNQTGAAWFNQAIPVAAGFDTTFSFRITPPAVGTKAEGMAFIIQNASASVVGGTIWGIGYGAGQNNAPLANSLAIELDTFQDGFLNDTSSNEITLHTRGILPNDENEIWSIGRVTPAVNLSNGQVHTLRIRYVPGTIEVYADNLVTPVLTRPYTFSGGGTYLSGGASSGGLNLPNGSAFVGFAATTGAGTLTELVEILSWQFTSTPLTDPCYAGTVQSSVGTPVNVLLVNNSAGNFLRDVQVPTFQPITLSMLQPAMTPAPAAFAVLAVLGKPNGTTNHPFPGIGTLCFPVLPPFGPETTLIADSFGTGIPALAGASAAPWSVTLNSGLPAPFQLTFQGMIQDMTSPTGVSTTNAVTLNVFQPPAPTITSITPNSAAVGAPITVNGTGFLPSAVVRVNGLPVVVTSISPTQIVLPFPAATPCGSTLSVTNLDGLAASRVFNPMPVITNTFNSQGPAAGGTSFLMIGNGFAPGSTVTIGGIPANVTNAAASLVQVQTPANTPGPKTVIVTTPGNCQVMTTFTYL